ncbi:MAG TPA: cell envelope biogenesis protein TolA [Allosphingosinicella sp.]
MDRTEATAVGVAVAGHAALLALLGMGFAPPDPTPKQAPIEIEMVTEEAAPVSTAPTPSAQEPAPFLAPEEGPPAPAAAEPMPQPLPVPQVQPTPVPRVAPTPPRPAPTPSPVPRAVQRPQPPRPAPPQPKPAPPAASRPAPKAAPKAVPKAAPPAAAGQPKGSAARPTGRLNGLLSGLGARDTPSKATAPPAQAAGPAVQASLRAEIQRQLKPHWRAPTGADVEQLRTTVRASLTRSGAVASIGQVTTIGQTASNRSQVKLHQEQAIRAVRLAAPFRLPADYYDAWKEIAPVFDRRLSQ